jgi:hypothetical protein
MHSTNPEGCTRFVWITWERHRRTREIAGALGIPLLELLASDTRWKYIGLLARSTMALVKMRPTHVFVQCPSLVLATWLAMLKRIFGYGLIADLHNEAVRPFVCQAKWYTWMVRRIHRAADLSIVSNDGLKAVVESNGGRTAVLADRVPDLHGAEQPSAMNATAPAKVVFVCTFAPDEPFLEVFEAARRLADVGTVYVTGKGSRWSSFESPGLRLTGFLPDAEYEALLRSADVIVDLTEMEDCLVCGAYEAVALERPLVTSDTAALRGYFRMGTVYTKHDADSIEAAIREAWQRRTELASEMRRLRMELDARWDVQRTKLVERLEALGGCKQRAVAGLDTRWVGGRK